MVDVVSLYPTVMLNCEYPCGTPRWVKNEDESKLGFYRVTV